MRTTFQTSIRWYNANELQPVSSMRPLLLSDRDGNIFDGYYMNGYFSSADTACVCYDINCWAYHPEHFEDMELID